MPVFISYRHTDRDRALAINNRLKADGITTYLDVLDPESQTTNDITGVITKNIAECTHLIAVVSQSTAESWWVPFEIGEATITNRRICSFQTGYNKLPEYLDKWPQMTKLSDLTLFIESYRGEGLYKRKMVFESAGSGSITASNNKRNADVFHEELKKKISRGF